MINRNIFFFLLFTRRKTENRNIFLPSSEMQKHRCKEHTFVVWMSGDDQQMIPGVGMASPLIQATVGQEEIE